MFEELVKDTKHFKNEVNIKANKEEILNIHTSLNNYCTRNDLDNVYEKLTCYVKDNEFIKVSMLAERTSASLKS